MIADHYAHVGLCGGSRGVNHGDVSQNQGLLKDRGYLCHQQRRDQQKSSAKMLRSTIYGLVPVRIPDRLGIAVGAGTLCLTWVT